MCHYSNLYHTYNNKSSFVILIYLQPFCKIHLFVILFHTTICYSAYNLYVSASLYSLDLYSEELQIVTWRNSAWISTDCCPLYLVFLYVHTFSLQNDLKVEDSWSRPSLSVQFVYAVSYLSVPFSLCLLLLVYF